MAESGPQKASEPDPDASRHSETAEEENPAIAAFNSWGGEGSPPPPGFAHAPPAAGMPARRRTIGRTGSIARQAQPPPAPPAADFLGPRLGHNFGSSLSDLTESDVSGGFARPLAPRRGTSPVRHGSEESSTGLSQPFAGLKLASTAEGSQALFAPSLSLIPSEPSVASSAQAPAPAARIVSLSEDSSGHSQALASPRRVTPATEDLQRYASGSMDGSGYGLSKAPPMPGSPPMPARAPAPAAAPAYPRQLTRTASQESSLLAPQHLHQPDDAPEEFVCPLSRRVMVDPVVAADGLSYERAAIAAAFLNEDARVAKLPHKMLVPNVAGGSISTLIYLSK